MCETYIYKTCVSEKKVAVCNTLHLPGYEQRGLKCALCKYKNGWKSKHIPENFSYFNLEISIVIYFFLEYKF